MLFKSFSDKIFTDSIEFGVKNGCASYMAYKFIILCKKDYRNWKAYNDGVINENGILVRETEIPLFDNLVRTIKNILIEVYGGEVNSYQKLHSFYITRDGNQLEDRKAKRMIADTLTEKEILLLEEILMEFKKDLN